MHMHWSYMPRFWGLIRCLSVSWTVSCVWWRLDRCVWLAYVEVLVVGRGLWPRCWASLRSLFRVLSSINISYWNRICYLSALFGFCVQVDTHELFAWSMLATLYLHSPRVKATALTNTIVVDSFSLVSFVIYLRTAAWNNILCLPWQNLMVTEPWIELLLWPQSYLQYNCSTFPQNRVVSFSSCGV